MDGEIGSFIKVWIWAIISLIYCYYTVPKIKATIPRLIFLTPILIRFTLLPLNLHSFHLCGVTSFFLVWLGNFKLILFAFNQGPLSPPPTNLLHFISLASLPININPTPNRNQSKPIHLLLKIVLLVLLFQIYDYKDYLNQYLILAFYCCNMYLELEIIFAITAIPSRALLGFEIEPQSNKPYLSTSLQDFWGRRWNLMVTGILRPTVYNAIRHIVGPTNGSALVTLPSVVATFAVSGLMHELIYYYITRASPTWEVTWFFVLHGFSTAGEVAVKRVVGDRWRLHPVVSRMLTLGYLAGTAFLAICATTYQEWCGRKGYI